MLVILQEEFNSVPFGYIDDRVYRRVRNEFLRLLKDEIIVDRILSKYWNYTLRELSCNSMIDIMACFILL